MSASGLYRAAQASQTTYEVRMDEVVFHKFQPGKRCIGTDGLNACTVVVIVSLVGVIFAHIAPNDITNIGGGGNDLGEQHMREKMDEFERLYRQHQETFPPGGDTWIVYALYMGRIASPEQKNIVEEMLTRLGLGYSRASYIVQPPLIPVFAPKGTVFVDASGEKPQIYVEDNRIG